MTTNDPTSPHPCSTLLVYSGPRLVRRVILDPRRPLAPGDVVTLQSIEGDLHYRVFDVVRVSNVALVRHIGATPPPRPLAEHLLRCAIPSCETTLRADAPTAPWCEAHAEEGARLSARARADAAEFWRRQRPTVGGWRLEREANGNLALAGGGASFAPCPTVGCRQVVRLDAPSAPWCEEHEPEQFGAAPRRGGATAIRPEMQTRIAGPPEGAWSRDVLSTAARQLAARIDRDLWDQQLRAPFERVALASPPPTDAPAPRVPLATRGPRAVAWEDD